MNPHCWVGIGQRVELASLTYWREASPMIRNKLRFDVALLIQTQDPHGGPPNNNPPGLIWRTKRKMFRNPILGKLAARASGCWMVGIWGHSGDNCGITALFMKELGHVTTSPVFDVRSIQNRTSFMASAQKCWFLSWGPMRAENVSTLTIVQVEPSP